MADSPKTDDSATENSAAVESEAVESQTAADGDTAGEAAQDQSPKPKPQKATGKDTGPGEIKAKLKKAAPRKVAAVAKSRRSGAAKPSEKKAPVGVSNKTRALKAAPVKKAATRARIRTEPAGNKVPSVKELKEKIMATNSNDYTEKMTDSMSGAVSQMQDRSKAAYDKSSEMVSEMSDMTRGTAEAVVESTKILAGGMQDMGKTYADEAKSAYEQMTADLKDMAGIKSPTELFQLQGKIMRRNFDAMVSATSKNTEMMMKLSNDAFAPLSARMNVAAEKMTKNS